MLEALTLWCIDRVDVCSLIPASSEVVSRIESVTSSSQGKTSA